MHAGRRVYLIIDCRRHYTDALAPVESSDRLWETPHRRRDTGGSNNGLLETPHRRPGAIGLSWRYEVRGCLLEIPHQCRLWEAYLVRCV